MVPQSSKDRNYRIPDVLAFQQPVAIQIANIDCTVSEPYVVAPEFVLHSKGRFSNVEQHLARESPEQPKDSQTIFGHPKRHRDIVAALEFQVDEALVFGFTEKVYPSVLNNLGQLYV